MEKSLNIKMTKEDMTFLLRDAQGWNSLCKNDKDRLEVILELANCAGDLACSIEDDETRNQIMDKTLNISQIIGSHGLYGVMGE